MTERRIERKNAAANENLEREDSVEIPLVTIHHPDKVNNANTTGASALSPSNSQTAPSYVASQSFELPEGHAIVDARPYEWQAPPDQNTHPYKPHQGEGSQYLRDFILGINDGLISTLLLVVGMVGGGAKAREILLAALAGAIAGSIAMGLGEYIATKSQNEVVDGEIKLEREHFKYHKDQEIAQLRSYLKDVGIEGPLLEAVVRKIADSDDHLMRIMEKFEFGAEANEDLERSPITAMFMSGRLFFMGAMPSALPFVQDDIWIGFIIACCLCSACLFGVGVYKTRTTGGSPWKGGLENFAAGAAGAIFSYCVGLLFNLIHP